MSEGNSTQNYDIEQAIQSLYTALWSIFTIICLVQPTLLIVDMKMLIIFDILY